jgi:hypothetical protein
MKRMWSPKKSIVLKVSEGEGAICVLQIQEIAGPQGDERARRNLSALRNRWLPMDLPKVHWKARLIAKTEQTSTDIKYRQSS